MNFLDQAIKYYFDVYFDVSQIKSGHTNVIYTFTANSKKYILRVYAQDPKTPRTVESISLEINLINLFCNKGIPSAAVIKNKRGEYLSQINDDFFDVLEFIEGEKVYGKLKPNYFQQVGETMAKMHKITEEEVLTTDIRWPEGDFWTHVFKVVDKNNILLKENAMLSDHLKPQISNLKSLAQYLIHGDFHFGNLLFKNDQLVAVLDFDHYRMGHFIDDIIRSFVAESAHTKSDKYWITQEFVDCFWNGYLSERELADDELNLILTYIDLHYLNQLIRLSKEDPGKIAEFKNQVEEIRGFTKNRLKL